MSEKMNWWQAIKDIIANPDKNKANTVTNDFDGTVQNPNFAGKLNINELRKQQAQEKLLRDNQLFPYSDILLDPESQSNMLPAYVSITDRWGKSQEELGPKTYHQDILMGKRDPINFLEASGIRNDPLSAKQIAWYKGLENILLKNEMARLASGGGGSGVAKPPPFKHDWTRPALPQAEYAGVHQWSGKDPHSPAPSRPRPPQFERSTSRYSKLLGY